MDLHSVGSGDGTRVRWRLILAAIPAMLSSLGAGYGASPGELQESVAAILDQADRVELISLDPRNRPTGPGDSFAGWKVLGRTTVGEPPARRAILDSLRRGFDEAVEGSGCFEPRHGVRATKRGRSIDLVVCFSCGWVEAREGDRTDWVRISGTPKAAINAALRDAGVPLAQDVEGP